MMRGPIQNVHLIDSAVLCLLDTDRQTDKQSIFIEDDVGEEIFLMHKTRVRKY